MRSRTILRQLRSAGPARCGAIARTQTGCQSASHPECVVSKNSNNVQFAVDNRLTFHSSPAMSDDPTVNPHIIVSSRNFNTIADHDLDPPTCQRPSRCQRDGRKIASHQPRVPSSTKIPPTDNIEAPRGKRLTIGLAPRPYV